MRVRGLVGVVGLFLVLSLSFSQTAHAEGVTIAVHGWHVEGAAEPSWTGAIQSAIADQRLDGEQNFGKITVTGSLGNLTATCSPWNVDLSASRTGEIVVRIDWHAVADHLVSKVPAQDIAAVVAPKIYNGQNDEQPLAELPIHIMGHSRGGGMVCELARLLGEQGIEVDHVSPLDPHPLTSSDPQPIPPTPPIIDTPVAVYENVLFVDSYWQDINYPEGEYVAGAYNREWTNIPGGYHNHANPAYRNVGDHHNITLMYHGTVDLNTPVNDGEATLGATERASWYNTYETDGGIGGQRCGFYYSRINGESDRLSTDTPVGGGDRIIDGYHDDPLLGGAGSRTGLTWSGAVWPNLVLLDILKDGTPLGPGDYYLSASEGLDLRYTYRDYDTGSDVTFYFDEDRNPYNANTIATISTHSHSASGASLVQTTVAWDTSTLPSGRIGYVCAEITDGSRARYLCAMPRIHTAWEAPLPMTPPGNALDLDGADDYVSLPAAISTPVESITVEAWVYSNALSQPSDYRAIVAEVDGGDSNVEFELFLDGGNHNLSAGFNDGSWHSINDADAFPTGEWVHVAATYDGHFMKLYRDGQQVAISSDLSLTLPDGVDGWRIGRSHDSGGVANLWNGVIDEVRVWGAARSESDIQSSMNIVLDGDETSLIAYYHFDHLSDSFLFDRTANDFHGTLANMADDDWVTSEAATGHKSHVGTGIGNLGENTDVPVDIMWDVDPGAGAIFAAIQVDDEPDVATGLLANYASSYWEVWMADDDGSFQADVSFHYDDVEGVTDETSLFLYTRSAPGQSWSAVAGFTRNYEGNSTDGVGSITADDLIGFSQFIITSDDNPIPVELVSFTATGGDGEAILRWSTESESDNLGFNVFRSHSEGGEYVRVTEELIEGAGTSRTKQEYTFINSGLTNGRTYWYQLADIASDGTERWHGPISVAIGSSFPTEFGLSFCSPNPFKSKTLIGYRLPEASHVVLEVYDLAGRLASVLVDEILGPGYYTAPWEATGAVNGVYLVQLRAREFVEIRKIVRVN